MTRLTAWSLEPFVMFSIICGIPSHFSHTRRNSYITELGHRPSLFDHQWFLSYHYVVKKIKFVLQSTWGSEVWIKEIQSHAIELIFFIVPFSRWWISTSENGKIFAKDRWIGRKSQVLAIILRAISKFSGISILITILVNLLIYK